MAGETSPGFPWVGSMRLGPAGLGFGEIQDFILSLMLAVLSLDRALAPCLVLDPKGLPLAPGVGTGHGLVGSLVLGIFLGGGGGGRMEHFIRVVWVVVVPLYLISVYSGSPLALLLTLLGGFILPGGGGLGGGGVVVVGLWMNLSVVLNVCVLSVYLVVLGRVGVVGEWWYPGWRHGCCLVWVVVVL